MGNKESRKLHYSNLIDNAPHWKAAKKGRSGCENCSFKPVNIQKMHTSQRQFISFYPGFPIRRRRLIRASDEVITVTFFHWWPLWRIGCGAPSQAFSRSQPAVTAKKAHLSRRRIDCFHPRVAGSETIDRKSSKLSLFLVSEVCFRNGWERNGCGREKVVVWICTEIVVIRSGPWTW